MRRKQPEPNYGLMFRQAVTALQMDYSLLKNAQINELRNGWFDNNGDFVELAGYKERGAKVTELVKRVCEDLKEVERLRRLRYEQIH